MSQPEVPFDLFDAVCRLDDIADWLEDSGYPDHAASARAVSQDLKGYIQLELTPKGRQALGVDGGSR